jgi:hypothetical protein
MVSADTPVNRAHQRAIITSRVEEPAGRRPVRRTGGAESSYENPQKGPPDHAIGRSLGGLSTKMHQLVDGRGRPWRDGRLWARLGGTATAVWHAASPDSCRQRPSAPVSVRAATSGAAALAPPERFAASESAYADLRTEGALAVGVSPPCPALLLQK